MNYNRILSYFSVADFTEMAVRLALCFLIYSVFHGISIWLVKFLPSLFGRIFRNKNENLKNACVDIFTKPLSSFIKFIGIYLAICGLPLNPATLITVRTFATKVMRVATLILISISLQNFVANIPDIFNLFNDNNNGANKTIIVFFTNLGKALVFVFSAVIVIEEFGYDITGLITGLGLGGLTFALAAQDIASNFMSGATILLDKTFSVGDWVTIGSTEGIVEEINFRSSRIRTFDNALITVPNSKISGDSITNWTKMKMRKTNIIIGLVYSTKKETLHKVCEEIYANLSELEEITPESLLVRFDNFSASSLDVKISYNSYAIPGAEHMALKEKVQYIIMDIVADNETDFAFNTVTVVSD